VRDWVLTASSLLYMAGLSYIVDWQQHSGGPRALLVLLLGPAKLLLLLHLLCQRKPIANPRGDAPPLLSNDLQVDLSNCLCRQLQWVGTKATPELPATAMLTTPA
jgi:hypothetical protein